MICSYEGERLSKEQVQEKGRNLDYVFGMTTGEGREQYIDALATHSCFGRFANDPVDDSLVNAKIVLRGKKLYLMATTEIEKGEEIYLSYGIDYWISRLGVLPVAEAAEIQRDHKRRLQREGNTQDQGKGLSTAHKEEATIGVNCNLHRLVFMDSQNEDGICDLGRLVGKTRPLLHIWIKYGRVHVFLREI